MFKIKEKIGSFEKIGKNRKNRSTGQPGKFFDSARLLHMRDPFLLPLGS